MSSDTTLIGAERNVFMFHQKYGFPKGLRIEDHIDGEAEQTLRDLSAGLLVMSRLVRTLALKKQETGEDPRLYRAHLQIEEVGELLEAMADGDEVALGDALADLMYVTLGTGIAFSIPVAECFDEVHRSNMTKTRDEGDERMKSRDHKGFHHPNIREAIDLARNEE